MEIDIVKNWRHGVTYLEDDDVALEVRCLFDFDYEYFLLLQKWNKHHPEDGWTYSLWFIGLETDGERVYTWGNQELDAPFVAAAELVEKWVTRKNANPDKYPKIISSVPERKQDE